MIEPPEILRQRVKQLANEIPRQASPYDWFEILYSEANGNASQVPWAKLTPHPSLQDWSREQSCVRPGKTALVVGCGLGDDAEALARLGLRVTAFDISPTAVSWCARRFPDSSVTYQVADLFNLSPAWNGCFDLVFECRNLQALPIRLRSRAISKIGPLIAPQGCLLVITRLREGDLTSEGPPWPLSERELAQFAEFGLQELQRQHFREGTAEVESLRIEYRRA
jgi:2-polyprenyl-3-methyl-5-hydroxy-6-metoxy-1,4-benzoquinol methylase